MYSPVALIGWPISTFRLSIAGAPDALTASAISAVVTAPNRRPESPALVVMTTAFDSSESRTALASSSVAISRALRALRIAVTSF